MESLRRTELAELGLGDRLPSDSRHPVEDIVSSVDAWFTRALYL